jgi:predicted ABC-type sugar transport system permease subunit
MLTNKWVQAVLLFGLGLGLIIGTLVSILAPMVVVLGGVVSVVAAAWIVGSARGTDGWGGPYRGPRP